MSEFWKQFRKQPVRTVRTYLGIAILPQDARQMLDLGSRIAVASHVRLVTLHDIEQWLEEDEES